MISKIVIERDVLFKKLLLAYLSCFIIADFYLFFEIAQQNGLNSATTKILIFFIIFIISAVSIVLRKAYTFLKNTIYLYDDRIKIGEFCPTVIMMEDIKAIEVSEALWIKFRNKKVKIIRHNSKSNMDAYNKLFCSINEFYKTNGGTKKINEISLLGKLAAPRDSNKNGGKAKYNFPLILVTVLFAIEPLTLLRKLNGTLSYQNAVLSLFAGILFLLVVVDIVVFVLILKRKKEAPKWLLLVRWVFVIVMILEGVLMYSAGIQSLSTLSIVEYLLRNTGFILYTLCLARYLEVSKTVKWVFVN